FASFYLSLDASTARYEPSFLVRLDMAREDWRYCRRLLVLFLFILPMAAFLRNMAWYAYIEYLPDVELGFRAETSTAQMITLLICTFVLIACVVGPWLFFTGRHLGRVANDTEMFDAHTSDDFIDRLPRLAAWVARFFLGR
ncbi:MAG: hypothetical protein AAGG01_22700, partial [Planctomycetota bacterium]